MNKNGQQTAFEVTRAQEKTGQINAGLRAYLLRVYQLMGLGLLFSAATAFLGTTPFFMSLLFNVTSQGIQYSVLGWLVIIAPLILVFMFGSAIRQGNSAKAQTLFWVFSGLMGFSFTTILLVFTPASLFQTFIIASGSFGALCLYGYTTKRDLTSMGAFMQMGLWGLIISMIVNFFMQSPTIAYGISILGVAIFVGLTAFDSQKIKMIYSDGDSKEMVNAKAVSGALTLYLDFINLFLMLIQLNGNRR